MRNHLKFNYTLCVKHSASGKSVHVSPPIATKFKQYNLALMAYLQDLAAFGSVVDFELDVLNRIIDMQQAGHVCEVQERSITANDAIQEFIDKLSDSEEPDLADRMILGEAGISVSIVWRELTPN